jgi:hypothetical protein
VLVEPVIITALPQQQVPIQFLQLLLRQVVDAVETTLTFHLQLEALVVVVILA